MVFMSHPKSSRVTETRDTFDSRELSFVRIVHRDLRRELVRGGCTETERVYTKGITKVTLERKRERKLEWKKGVQLYLTMNLRIYTSVSKKLKIKFFLINKYKERNEKRKKKDVGGIYSTFEVNHRVFLLFNL